jgi:hypothetical protein
MRVSDIFQLALLKLPVRCRTCKQRYHVAYRLAFRQLHWQQSRSFMILEAQLRRAKLERERVAMEQDAAAILQERISMEKEASAALREQVSMEQDAPAVL